MDQAQYLTCMRRAKRLTGDYGLGYQSGLRRHYHGEKFGDPLEHEAKLRRQDEYVRGYRDGLAAIEPRPLYGRPPLSPDAPRSDKRVRSVRLSDDDWEKLKALGTQWLESAIEKAELAVDNRY